jgi:hypothetical protein
MERAVYCYGWLPDRPNCHPVHTMKNAGMVEELERSRGRILAWSMMGSGAISLPFLERQIHGDVPPQLRFHGFMNEREFNERCLALGMLPFAVVYQAQGWEFPVVFGKDDAAVLDMNMPRPSGPQEWYGLREFTQDRHWKAFGKKFKDYFPEGIRNSDGQEVTDLWEECAARDLRGNPAHTGWVEVEGYTKTCHNMCRNNPAWRAYLKKIVEIQIDAGAMGVQLDESEAPICSISFGGCFCKDCMKQFNAYLVELKERGKLSAELADIDLRSFHYGRFLLERGVSWPGNFLDVPFADLYWDFMIASSSAHFKEMIDYVKEYGRRRGKDVKVSGNMTNMHLIYLPVRDSLDYCVTELRRTLFKRHNWYRLAVGYTKDKPVIIAESPYDGFMPKFVELLKKGRAYDLYALFIMEAAMHGCDMAFPLGAWMGNKTRDSFNAPPVVGEEVQGFLFRHDRIFGKRSGAKVAVLYSYPSYKLRDWQSGFGESLKYEDVDDLLTYEAVYDSRSARMPFFELTQRLCDMGVNYDVVVTGDGELVGDDFELASLAGYSAVIAPDCHTLTNNQAEVLEGYARGKGRLFVYGRIAENVSGRSERLLGLEGVSAVRDIEDAKESLDEFVYLFAPAYEEIWRVRCDNPKVHFQEAALDDSTVIHLVNYAYDKGADRIVPQRACLDVRCDAIEGVVTHTIDETPLRYRLLSGPEGVCRILIEALPAYAALELKAVNTGKRRQ